MDYDPKQNFIHGVASGDSRPEREYKDLRVILGGFLLLIKGCCILEAYICSGPIPIKYGTRPDGFSLRIS